MCPDQARTLDKLEPDGLNPRPLTVTIGETLVLLRCVFCTTNALFKFSTICLTFITPKTDGRRSIQDFLHSLTLNYAGIYLNMTIIGHERMKWSCAAYKYSCGTKQ